LSRCCCCCRILPWWREKMTVRHPVMNPAQSRMMTFLTVVTVTLGLRSLASIRTIQLNKPRTAVSCRHLRCQRRRENESYCRASKFYRVVTVMRKTRLTTSRIDDIVRSGVVSVLNVPLTNITSAQIHRQGSRHKLLWHMGRSKNQKFSGMGS